MKVLTLVVLAASWLAIAPVLAASAPAKPAPAPAVTTGYIDAYTGIYSASTQGLYSGDETDAVGYLIGGDGFSNTWLGKTLAAQFDGNFRGYTAAGGSSIDSLAAWNFTGGAHLAYRDPDKDAAAIFGALDISNGATFASNDDGGRSTAFGLLGAEGQAYLDNVTLYLQGGVALPLPQDVNTNGAFWQTYGTFAFVRGVLRYFPTDNIRIQAEATYARGTTEYHAFAATPGGADVNIFNARLEADYRPDGSNTSYFAAVEGTVNWQTQGIITQQVTSVRLLSGAVVDFGQDTLKARDRKGVTWDLPRFGDMMQAGDQINFCPEDSDCVPD